MRLLSVVLDLWEEAARRRWFLGLAVAVTGLLLTLMGGLKLDVLDGALAGTRLFGHVFSSDIQAVDTALGFVFEAASYVVFYGGMLFGIFACADFGPSLLAPGRIEHLLALPVRRWELLGGTFLGVLGLALGAAAYGAGGLTIILGVKTGYWTVRPLLSALLAAVGFGSLYAAMLSLSLFVRSAALSGLLGLGLFVSGILASHRDALLRMFSDGPSRALFAGYTLVMPRIGALADAAGSLASGHAEPRRIAELLLGFALFGLAALAVGLWRFEERDF